MLFPINDRQNLKDLEELATLQNQVKVVRLQNKLGKQNFHEDLKKVFEPVIKFLKDISEEMTKTMTENFRENNKAIEKLNGKILEMMNDKGMIAPCLVNLL